MNAHTAEDGLPIPYDPTDPDEAEFLGIPAPPTAESDAIIRDAVADMIRDHTMPPNKDRRGYDYRMGWWDAVTYLDSLVKRRVREARVTSPAVKQEDR